MLTLHCTNKFMAQLGLKPSSGIAELKKTILGDWSATYFYHNDDKVFLFVNNATLFSFTLHGLAPDMLDIEIFAGLIDSLHRANVPFDIIEKIRKESIDIIFVKNTNRRIIGSINNLIYMYQFTMKQYPDIYSVNMSEVERKMIRVPFKYLSYKFPIEVLKDKLGIK